MLVKPKVSKMVYCNLTTTKKHRNENKAGLLNVCLVHLYKPKVGTVSFIHMPKADIILTANGLLPQIGYALLGSTLKAFLYAIVKLLKF